MKPGYARRSLIVAALSGLLVLSASGAHGYTQFQFAKEVPRSQNQWINSEARTHYGARATMGTRIYTLYAALRHASSGALVAQGISTSKSVEMLEPDGKYNTVASCKWSYPRSVSGQNLLSCWAYR